MQTVDILGVPIACVNLAQMLGLVVEWAQAAQARCLAYANAHSLNLANQNPHFRSVLRAADLVYADGISVVWAARWLYQARLEKMTGRIWIDDLCAVALQNDLRLYLLAGVPGVTESAAQKLQQRFQGLQIAGTADGYFAAKSVSEVLSEIERTSPQIVLVGMGSPQQETWVAQHRTAIAAPVCWSVGALFDYIAGREAETPAWLDRLGLEWFWRLGMDPTRKWQRYILGNPLFVMRVWQQKLGQRK